MKTHLALLAIVTALILSVSPASAQAAFSVQELYNSSTNSIAASGTASPTDATITAKKFLNVAIQPQFKLSGTGTGNVTFSFAKGLSGGIYETTPSVTVVVAASGTNVVSGVTNVNLGAVSALKLVSIVNANTPSTATNVVVNYAIKPGEK